MSVSLLEELFQEEIYQVPCPVLIIVPEWHNILEEDKALLAKILSSVKLSMGSVAILSANEISIEQLKTRNARRVLNFGGKLRGADARLYEKTVVDDITIINADPLDALDDPKKKSLWAALKQTFTP